MSPFGSPLGDLIQDLRHTSDPDTADRVLNVAVTRGVDPATCTALRAEWDEKLGPPQRIYSDPVTDATQRHPAGGAVA